MQKAKAVTLEKFEAADTGLARRPVPSPFGGNGVVRCALSHISLPLCNQLIERGAR
jgi:hypothetical protein